jgi:ABC-2 type transport system permease protein
MIHPLLLAAMRLELRQLRADGPFVGLTVLAAVSFLVLVSLFGLTASDAPMALVLDDRGPYARHFVKALVEVPHAFRLTRMTHEQASAALGEGRLVGAITIPANFSAEIASGKTVALEVEVDNVNVDIVTDVQRSLPSAILAFGKDVGLPGVRVRLDERDVWSKDTSFLPYITVSGLALDALLIAGVLGALAVAREWERRTIKLWRLAPAAVGTLLAGKLAATALVAGAAIAIATVVVIVGYGVTPASPLAAAAGVLVCIFSFTCVGALLGALVRRTLILVPLLFGLAMPLFIDSGALEPTRFDGESIWWVSHLTPLYYAVGFFQWAFFGLRITPEPVWTHLVVLGGLGTASFLGARRLISSRVGRVS